jgi:maleate cis-trans isomerase
VFLNLKSGSRAEYSSAFPIYEMHLAYLASLKCNVISVEGAPPFMLLGPKGEAEKVDGWKKKYNTDMFTSSQNQVNAFRALKVKRILGITSGSGGPEMEKVYAKYFEDSGFGVVAFVGMGIEFNAIQDVPPATIAAFIKKSFAEHKGADAVYVLGSSLEALPLVAPLEKELGVPVVQPVCARIWEIQRRLKVHEPIKGYGRLLETLLHEQSLVLVSLPQRGEGLGVGGGRLSTRMARAVRNPGPSFAAPASLPRSRRTNSGSRRKRARPRGLPERSPNSPTARSEVSARPSRIAGTAAPRPRAS